MANATSKSNAGKDGNGQKNRPFKTIRRGGMKAVIWLNETKNGPMLTAQLVRIYRDDAGNWQQTNSYNAGDLLDGAKLLDTADTIIHREMERWEQEKSRQREPGEDPIED